MAGVSVLVLGVFVLFYKIIVTISFDEEFARARNLPVNFFNYFLISLSALAIVASIRVSGVILVLSLLTLPQATANLFTQTFRPIMVLSVLVGFVGMVSGLLLSFYTNMPSGASIILVLTAVFFIARMVVYARSRFR
jgi:zinc transport system permease protein